MSVVWKHFSVSGFVGLNVANVLLVNLVCCSSLLKDVTSDLFSLNVIHSTTASIVVVLCASGTSVLGNYSGRLVMDVTDTNCINEFRW